ncbi:hypothetical protein CNMCM8927_008611 [Aspergillus lentulus]|uniref:Retrovirus-related Pol polyprotein from transposon TNT 1-94 n=1 Tax=Aspergillus lentulus TaxID=293939 RepID=A0AAN6BN41_ASPLE|nr:hypothetical protein CNMCM8927_008611 [Aspergillus lentulus]
MDQGKLPNPVGSLMYIVLGIREDIAYAVSMASVYLANPGPQHMKLARHILRYLNGTKNLRLTYKGQLQTPKGFTDADWGGCRGTRRLAPDLHCLHGILRFQGSYCYRFPCCL